MATPSRGMEKGHAPPFHYKDQQEGADVVSYHLPADDSWMLRNAILKEPFPRFRCPSASILSAIRSNFVTAIRLLIADQPLVPVFTAGSVFPCVGVPVCDAPDLIRSNEQSDKVATALGEARAVLSCGHSAVVVGEDIVTCFNARVWLEENAKKQLWASSLGAPRVFSADELTRVRARMWQPSVIRKTWDFCVAQGCASGVL